MSVFSYNKLWKILIDKKMYRKDLRLAAGISTAVMAKLGKGENVTTDILLRICDVFDCDITDIMEIERGTASPLINGVPHTQASIKENN
jgi:DNA-binding Xre family transcriptional regulator